MHDIGMNTGQLAGSIQHIDDAIALARSWSHDLFHAADAHQMEQTAAKLQQVMVALDEARDALAGYEDAVESDHNAVGSVRLV